ncbi:hypothetical protein KAM479c_21830 (plasmid) [Aeromonas caviae]|nr:hypothetical protein KAM479c_21830 [Aeromonas caviae]
MTIHQALLQQALPILDLGGVHDKHPGRIDPSGLQLRGGGQTWRGDEKDPATVRPTQLPQGIEQRRFLMERAAPLLLSHLALMASGPGGDQTGRRGRGAKTQGLAHMSFLYE